MVGEEVTTRLSLRERGMHRRVRREPLPDARDKTADEPVASREVVGSRPLWHTGCRVDGPMGQATRTFACKHMQTAIGQSGPSFDILLHHVDTISRNHNICSTV